MEIAALAGWIVAAICGLRLLWLWLASGGLRRQPAKVTRFPRALTLGHPLLAVTGLGLWTEFVRTGQRAYGWSAFGLLILVFVLGFLLLTRWLVGSGGRHARGAGRSFPRVAVIAHGVAAVVTFVLVSMATAGHKP